MPASRPSTTSRARTARSTSTLRPRYKINEHFTLTVEAINLTDEYTDQYIDSAADRLSVYHHTGRQFYFGGRFKF